MVLKKVKSKLSNAKLGKKISKQVSIPRVPTGVHGFDDLVEGGLPEKDLILLTGSSGTGKTTFAMNFLVEGARKGENGVYISLEEPVESHIKKMKLFGFGSDDLVKQKKILITEPDLYDFDKLLTHIEDSVLKVKAKRLVIDSTSLIGLYFKDDFKVRTSLMDLGKSLRRLGCTTLAINEVKENSRDLSSFGVEEFIADGVIVLYLIKKNNIYTRGLSVRKMRLTNHSLKVHPVQIVGGQGIVVYPTEEVFTEF